MNITDRQLEIIQAAGKRLAGNGLSGLTVKTLAADMGFVESALYRHFKSKDDILVLMLEYLYQNIQERFEPILAQDVDAKTKLVQIFDSQFRYFCFCHLEYPVSVFVQSALTSLFYHSNLG